MSLKKKLGTSTYTKTRVNNNGIVQYISGIENVRQSIVRALAFEGDAYFFPEKDSKLGEIQFRARTRATARLGAQFMRDTILNEVRTVRFVTIDFDLPSDQPDVIKYIITFEVEEGRSEDAFIYPFYLNNTTNQAA